MPKRLLFALFFLLAFCPPGCRDSNIPLFNSQARPLNRIYSAKEILVELNLTVARYVQNGWLTQDYVDANIGPVLDQAQVLTNDAEALYKAANEAGAVSKIEAVSRIIRPIREWLATIKKRHS